MAMKTPGVVANTRANTQIPKAPKQRDYTNWTQEQANKRRQQLEFEINRRPDGAQNFQQELKELNARFAPGGQKPPTTSIGDMASNFGDQVNQTPTTQTIGDAAGTFGPNATNPTPNVSNFIQDPNFNADGYLGANADVAAEAQRLKAAGDPRSIQEIAEAHYNSNGKAEGRGFGAPAAAAPPTVETPAGTTEAAPPASTTADLTNYQSPMTKALLEAMGEGMNSMRAYEPKYFEGSPLYQFQKQQGTKDLSALLASRGLTGSGAEIQAHSDFLGKLGADESEKQRQYAEGQATRNMNALQFIANFDNQERENLRNQGNLDADRLQRYQFDQSSQAQQDKQLMTNFLQGIMGLQAQNSPYTAALEATSGQGQTNSTLAKLMQEYIAGQYGKAIPSGGGGGGGGRGGSAAPPITQAPPADNTNLLLAQLMANYGNNAGNNDVLGTGLSGLFSLFK